MQMSENEAKSAMDRFNDGLRQVLSVSKTDLHRLLEKDKASKAGKVKRGPKPKSSASARVSRESA